MKNVLPNKGTKELQNWIYLLKEAELEFCRKSSNVFLMIGVMTKTEKQNISRRSELGKCRVIP